MTSPIYTDYFRPWNGMNYCKTMPVNNHGVKAESTHALDLSQKSRNVLEDVRMEKRKKHGNRTKTNFTKFSSPNQYKDVCDEKNESTPLVFTEGFKYDPLHMNAPHHLVLQQLRAYYQFVNNLPLLHLQQQRLLELAEKRTHNSKHFHNFNMTQHFAPNFNTTPFSPMVTSEADLCSPPITPTLSTDPSCNTSDRDVNMHSVQLEQKTKLLEMKSSSGTDCASSPYPLPSAKDGEPLDLLPKSLYMNKAHGGHLCIFCGKLYSRKYGLKIHLRTHTGYKPLKCKICQRPFGDPSNLNKHIRLHAEGETPYRCNYCGKVLVRRRDLDRHIRSRHPGKCDNLPLDNASARQCDSDNDFEVCEELDVVG